MQQLRILSPTGILGYGFPLESFITGMKLNPHLIAVDGGSTDPGPYYLGAGKSFTKRKSVKRDLGIILETGLENGCKIIIGSAGGSGGYPHLKWTVDIIDELVKEHSLSFKMAVINAELKKDLIHAKFDEGKITPLYPAPQITHEDIDKSSRIVAQMGVDPFIEALKQDAQVIIAGRSYDPSVFAAMPVYKGFDTALSLHLGKILECACIASEPGSASDCMFGWLEKNFFEVAPLNPSRKCTKLSVAAHTLYEKSDPYKLYGPGGMLDLTNTVYHQSTDSKVKVSGTTFLPSDKYAIKLEGAKLTGYRTISISAVRDPFMIAKIKPILENVKKEVFQHFTGNADNSFLNFIIYGKNGVMGHMEPLKNSIPHELCLIIETICSTQEESDNLCSLTRSTLLHYGYEGRLSTGGNLAFPYSPSDIPVGEVYEFNIYHLMEVDNPVSIFPLEIIERGL